MSEYLNNIDYCYKMSSIPVKYTSTVQLLHLSSKKFLSIPLDAYPDNFSSTMKLSLVEIPSESSLFKLKNVFKY